MVQLNLRIDILMSGISVRRSLALDAYAMAVLTGGKAWVTKNLVLVRYLNVTAYGACSMCVKGEKISRPTVLQDIVRVCAIKCIGHTPFKWFLCHVLD